MSYERIDFSGSLGACERTSQGGVIVPSFLTKPGIFTYTDENGNTIREFRPPEEVFSPASMASLRAAPVTLGHPPPERPVVTTNWKELSIGHLLGDAREESGMVAADLVIQDAAGIQRIEAGIREVSCGYRFETLDNTPGEWNGQAYDRVQRGISYNHVALVKKGRAGADVRLRLDSAQNQITEIEPMTMPAAPQQAQQVPPPVPPKPAQDATAVGANLPAETSEQTPPGQMPASVVVDRQPAPQAPGAPAPAVDAAPAAPASVEDQIKALSEQVATLTSQVATLQGEKAELAQDKARSDSEVMKLRDPLRNRSVVAARVALERDAHLVLGGETATIAGKPTRLDSLSDRDLRIAIVGKVRHDSAATLATKDDGYLTGVCDIAVADFKAGRSALDGVSNGQRQDNGRQDAAPKSGREKMLEKGRDASRSPLRYSKDGEDK